MLGTLLTLFSTVSFATDIKTTKSMASVQAAIQSGDYGTAYVLLNELAKTGDAKSQFDLARLYQNGLGVVQDEQKARQVYEQAAQQGYVDAQTALASLLAMGRGGEKNIQQATQWFLLAAEKGDVHAQYSLGMIAENRLSDLPADKGAHYWYKLAAENDYAPAQSNLGYLFQLGVETPVDYDLARFWYLKAAQQGDLKAQNNLGILYTRGLGVERNYNQAFLWYEKAALGGFEKAMTNLGVMYENGHGVEANETEAVKWYRKGGQADGSKYAANGQDATTQIDRVGVDYSKLNIRDIEKLAHQSDPVAQGLLGQKYYLGSGVPQDYVLAHKWTNLSISSGRMEWLELRETLNSLMTPSQINEAQSLARDFVDP